MHVVIKGMIIKLMHALNDIAINVVRWTLLIQKVGAWAVSVLEF